MVPTLATVSHSPANRAEAASPVTDIRVLTVRQPWAAAILALGKDVENRTRSLGPFRGTVAIHASAGKSDDRAYIAAALASPYFAHADGVDPDAVLDELPMVFGSVLGVVTLTGVHRHTTEFGCASGEPDAVSAGDVQRTAAGARMCSPWAMPNLVHHHVQHARLLRRPIVTRGKLGLWRPDPDLATLIRAA